MAFVYDDAVLIKWLGIGEMSDYVQVGVLQEVKNEVDWRVIEYLEKTLHGDLLQHFKQNFANDFPAEIAYVERSTGSLNGVFQSTLAAVLREVLEAEGRARNELL